MRALHGIFPLGKCALFLRSSLPAALLFVAFCFLSGAGKASAMESIFPMPIPHVNLFALVGGAYPEYYGSKYVNVGAAPYLLYEFDGDRYVELIANELRINLLDDPNWRFGPDVFYRFGRSDVQDDMVNRLDDIDDSVDVGAFAGYTFFDKANPLKRLTLSVYTLADVGGVSNGVTIGGSAVGMWPVFEFMSIAGGQGLTWADKGFMDTYFGVDDSNALASGLTAYAPGSGLRDTRTYLGLVFHLSEKWHFGFGGMFTHYLETAADSPVVDDRGAVDNWTYGGGVMYAW